jgi:hypothetical protein
VNLELDSEQEEEEVVFPLLQMPFFLMVTELAITFLGVDLRMPKIGTFAKLYIFGVQLTGNNGYGIVGISDVVSWRCPCLQDLEPHQIEGLNEFFLSRDSSTSSTTMITSTQLPTTSTQVPTTTTTGASRVRAR